MTLRREYNDRKQWFACVLQINFLYKFRKLYRKIPVLESLLNKLIHRCSSEICEIFKNNFFTKHIWWLLLNEQQSM